MHKLPVLARDIVFALQGRAQGTVHYLDTESGEVIPVFSYNRDRILAAIHAAPNRYVRLAPRTMRRDYEVMARFIETVDDDRLRERLRDAVTGDSVFARFRTELADAPAERCRWEKYRAREITANLREKMRASGIEIELVFD